MKVFKKITACFLICIMTGSLLFTGCSKDSEDKKNNEKEENKKEDIKPADTPNNDFDKYMQELFIDEMSDNSVSTHFSLENPEAYGITFEKASWGEPITEDYIKEGYAEQKDIMERLEEFDYSSLTDAQQLTYDTLYSYLENSYKAKDYYLFDEVFSPNNGLQSQIPIIFSEYDIFDENDIEDYIYLMETVDDYISSYLEYERLRAKKGYFLTEDSVDTVVKQCEEFITPEENCLISIFSEKLDTFGVDKDKKTDYMDRFETAIKENLIPAYKDIISTLNELKGSRTTELGLSEFENGKKYYESLVRSYTGSEKPVDELIVLVEQSLVDNITLVYNILDKYPDMYDEYLDFEYPTNNPETTIEMQIKKAKKYFPEIDKIPYQVKSVPKSLESTMSPAFYLVPPIDNKDKNMIYINHSEEYEHMNLFTTLAHEGVPGHMYQCYYFANTNPDPIRNVLSFGGYTEGWATYIESYSYYFAGMSQTMAKLAFSNDQYNLAIYSRIDLGIHYEGWDLDDVTYFLGIYGVYDDTLCEELYNTMIDDPAVYLQYYIGSLEFLELLDEAEKKIDSFDLSEFHKFILETGPTFFDILADELDEWIEEENSL